MSNNLKLIAIDRLIDPERPLRSDLTPESVDELVFSIKEVGLIQPLIVCENGQNYEVIAGHRRFLACQLAGLVEIPCVITDVKNLDKEVLKMHENIAREDINPIDWANHLIYLKKQYDLTNAKLAELTGFSTSWVEQHLNILNYPPEVLGAIKDGKLAFSAARELAQINDPVTRKVYTESAVKGGVTPGMAAQWRRQANGVKPQPTEQSTTEGMSNPEGGLPEIPVICPVCGDQIPSNEIILLQVHNKCRPANL